MSKRKSLSLLLPLFLSAGLSFNAYAGPVCGDGTVEGDEECDEGGDVALSASGVDPALTASIAGPVLVAPLIEGAGTLHLRDVFSTHLEPKWFQAEAMREHAFKARFEALCEKSPDA